SFCVYFRLWAVVSFVKFLMESLTCNKCDVGLVGVCLNAADQVCTTNTSRCFTGKASNTFLGFNTQGCLEGAMCNTTDATLMGATYTTVRTCCDTNKCNPVTISGATSAKLSVTTALSATLVASVWGSMLY
uniref:UPAR/Ly6 domain-containing protein n=1 Tax=Oncorhynchus kisutch TaxID=8019 RepID=A0A8C7H5W6_ONCKI